MTARKDTNKDVESADKAQTSSDKAQAPSGTLQTTKQAEERQEALSTSPEKQDDVDNKAFEGVEDVPVEGENVESPNGVVVERNLDGDNFEVPYTMLTAADLARTSDSDDPVKDWTAQHASGEREDEDGNTDPVALVEVAGTPGQTFRVNELPDRETVEAAGIDYDQWVSGLPVRAEVPNEAPRRGIPA